MKAGLGAAGYGLLAPIERHIAGRGAVIGARAAFSQNSADWRQARFPSSFGART